VQLTIDKLIYGGDGFARLPADEHGRGKAVFVPFVLEGERVEAAVVEEKPGFVRARADKILAGSPQRVEPGCPYFLQCGGCHYQHTGYENQLQIKAAILLETLRRGAKIELEPAQIPVQVHASPPWQYRNRTRMKLTAAPEFALGYFRFGSHELLPVEQCPISSPLINRAIQAVWQLGRAGKVNQQLFEIEFFANQSDTELLVEINVPDQYWKNKEKPNVVDFAADLRAAMPEITGVAVFRGTPSGALVREEVPDKLKDVFGADHLVYGTQFCQFQVSAGSFFQTNRHLTDVLLNLVIEGRSGELALDLYAGTGLFTLPLSQNFREVLAVEAAPFSFHDLKCNTPSNVRAVHDTTERYVGGIEADCGVGKEPHFDVVIVDPPRTGLGDKVAKSLGSLLTPRLTYVSCDPSTLARDLKVLLASGFQVEEIHLVDLFPQTFHIETVVQLER
jgi:23S rRNA (uracil1939-C5)-methyltransferase